MITLLLVKNNTPISYSRNETGNPCKSTAIYHACLSGVLIYDLKERPACEPSLLINPTVDSLKTCEIQITTNSEPFWKPLAILSCWLYSFSKAKGIVIIGHSTTPIKINHNGTRILKLTPGCMAKTRDTIHPGKHFSSWTDRNDIWTRFASKSKGIIPSDLQLRPSTKQWWKSGT